MIKKRLFALAMTAVMAMSTSVVAFAEQETTVANISSTLTTAVTAEGSLKQANIKVVVPTSAPFIINPYKLEATVASTTKFLQVFSPEYSICNVGDVALSVDMTVSAKTTGTLTLASNPVASTSTKKEIFLFINFGDHGLPSVAKAVIDDTDVTKFDKDGVVTYARGVRGEGEVVVHENGKTYYAVDKSMIEAGSNDGEYVLTDAARNALADNFNYTVTSKSMIDKTVTPNVTYTLETYKLLDDGEYDKSANNQAAISTKDTTFKNVGTIVPEAVAMTDGGMWVFGFSIAGSTSVNPANDPWTEADTATVNIKFSFTPVILED